MSRNYEAQSEKNSELEKLLRSNLQTIGVEDDQSGGIVANILSEFVHTTPPEEEQVRVLKPSKLSSIQTRQLWLYKKK